MSGTFESSSCDFCRPLQDGSQQSVQNTVYTSSVEQSSAACCGIIHTISPVHHYVYILRITPRYATRDDSLRLSPFRVSFHRGKRRLLLISLRDARQGQQHVHIMILQYRPRALSLPEGTTRVFVNHVGVVLQYSRVQCMTSLHEVLIPLRKIYVEQPSTIHGRHVFHDYVALFFAAHRGASRTRAKSALEPVFSCFVCRRDYRCYTLSWMDLPHCRYVVRRYSPFKVLPIDSRWCA